MSVERKKIDERREAKNFGFKNKKFKKEDTTLLSSVCLVESLLLLARTLCAVNIHSITLTNTNFSTTRAFSERKRKECVNNGNANASIVSTNDATKIDAKQQQQHSKIIVEKENI